MDTTKKNKQNKEEQDWANKIRYNKSWPYQMPMLDKILSHIEYIDLKAFLVIQHQSTL